LGDLSPRAARGRRARRADEGGDARVRVARAVDYRGLCAGVGRAADGPALAAAAGAARRLGVRGTAGGLHVPRRVAPEPAGRAPADALAGAVLHVLSRRAGVAALGVAARLASPPHAGRG